MDWKTLKEKVYYEDGSLRDILVKNTNIQDWASFVDFVNNNYKIQIRDHDTVIENARIDINKVINFWEDLDLGRIDASIFVGNALINVHFFGPSDIENDILPQEILSIDDHDQIIAYMITLSKALNKEVLLTADSTEDEVLITVNQENVIIS